MQGATGTPACQPLSMRISRKQLLLGLLAALPLAAAAVWPGGEENDGVITLATWNLEWLVAPGTAHAGRLACRSGQRSTLPCDVVKDLSRDSADLARLAAYARTLDADIVAFQEVENAEIAREVFRGYRICIATGTGAQQVGFAVRPHLPHRCGPEVESLSLNGRSRKAMSMLLTPARSEPMELLVVHLKSGCSRDPLDSGSTACRMLAQQAEHLGEWIGARSEQPFIVLGDFNRVPPATPDDAFWQLLHADLSGLVAAQLPFGNCYVGQPYWQFIDHILISPALRHRLVADSPLHSGFRSTDVVRYRLSDHCPVSISLNIVDSTRLLPE
jgi:endonuclease/exonuclease/phosphatase family metal-dependent hydrolase